MLIAAHDCFNREITLLIPKLYCIEQKLLCGLIFNYGKLYKYH